MGSLGRLPQGRLRLSAPMDFGRVELWPIAREFMRRYPNIHVELLLTNRVVDLIEEEIDLAIRMAKGPLDGSLIARRPRARRGRSSALRQTTCAGTVCRRLPTTCWPASVSSTERRAGTTAGSSAATASHTGSRCRAACNPINCVCSARRRSTAPVSSCSRHSPSGSILRRAG